MPTGFSGWKGKKSFPKQLQCNVGSAGTGSLEGLGMPPGQWLLFRNINWRKEQGCGWESMSEKERDVEEGKDRQISIKKGIEK